jgi:Ca2+-binding RTX toxin-like protein
MSSIIHGTSGDDVLTGTSGADTFQVGQGGDDTVNGLGGNDVVEFDASFTAADKVDGGSGNDEILLKGDYSAGLTLADDTITSVETITFWNGFDYKFTTVDANVAAGQKLTLSAGGLDASHYLDFDGSAELDGVFDITGGAGNDTLTGGAGADIFNLSHGGNDTASGGAGDDIFNMGAALNAGDRIDGDTGTNNILRLKGDYSTGLTLAPTTIANIQNVQLSNGYDYNLTFDAANFAPGSAVRVNASALNASWSATIDGSATSATLDFLGGKGDDTLIGGSGNDTFNIAQGGNDTVHGGDGNDELLPGAHFTADDQIDGGAGNDVLKLDGNYGHKVIFNAGTITNVETILLEPGFKYNLETNDGNVAAGQSLLVRGDLLGATDRLVFDGAAETDGHFIIRGGAGDDVLTGGALSDTINISLGGDDVVHGGGGDDVITANAALTAADCIDGGTGNDTITLNGDYSAGVVFSATTITNIETLSLAAGHSYNLTTNDANVAAGQTLTVDGSALGTGDHLTFDGSAETDGSFVVKGGADNDAITLSTGVFANSTVDGGAGTDTLTLTGGTTGLTVNTTNAANVETIALADGASYTGLAITGGVGGNNLLVDASALTATHTTNVDLTGDTATNIEFLGGGGDDTVTFDQNFDQTYFYQGGGGFNTAVFASGTGNSGTSWSIYASYMSNLDKIVVENSPYQNFRIAGDPSHNGTLTVDASALSAANSNTFRLGQSTVAHLDITDGAGNDTFLVGSALTAGTTLDAGGGNDTLDFGGARGVVTDGGVATLLNFEKFVFDAGYNYAITVNDATVASGQTLTVDASALASANSLTFDGSAETNGNFAIIGGAGNDVLTVGAAGGSIHAGAGDDTITDKGFTGTIDGGAGNDTLVLNAPAALSDTNDTGIDTVKFVSGGDYSGAISIAGDITSGSGTLLVDASAISDGVTVNLSGVTTTTVDFTGGAGDDTVIFSSDNDNWGTVNGGGGSNTFEFNDGGATIISGASVTNFSTLSFADGHDYSGIHVTGDITGDNGTLNVDASAVSGGYTVDVDLSGVTSSGIDFTGGAGDDTVLAGADLGNMTIDGGAGTNILKLDGDYSAGVTLSSVSNISEIDLAGGNAYNLTTTDATVAAGATLTVDASALGTNFGLTFDGSAETDGYFDIKGGAGDDSLTLQTLEVDNSTIDGGAGTNTLTLTGNLAGDESFSAASITHIDYIAYAAGSDAGYVSFTGDITGDGSTLTVDETNADGEGGSGPDGDMLITDISALTDTIDLTGGVIDDYVGVSSQNWTSLNGNGGNYNALDDVGTGPITFDAATITGFNALVFANSTDYAGINVVGDLTGNGGTVTIDAAYANSISIDVSQATSSFSFTGSSGNDTIVFGNSFTSGDTVAGNGGNDTLSLGNNTATLADTAVTGIGTVTLSGASTFAITGDISGSGTLTVDASALSDPLDQANIDFSQSTTGTIDFTGGAGDDTIIFGSNIANAGTVDGGGGTNTIALAGNGSDVTATFDGSSFSNFSTLGFEDGNNYDVTITNGFGGGGLTIDASALSASYGATLDVSQVTGTVDFTGGAGDDTVTFGTNFAAAASIDGGGGNDTLVVGQAGTLSDATITHIENVDFSGDASSGYDVSISGDLTSGGGTLSLDASQVQNGGVTFDLTGATTANFSVVGSAGEDTVILGPGENLSNFFFLGNYDTLELTGGSTGLTLDAATIQGVSDLTFADGASYTGITLIGDIVDNAGPLTIDASALTGSNSVDVDASQATSGEYIVTGGAGDDTFVFGGNVGQVYSLDGGGGTNTLALNGNGNDVNTYLYDTNFQNIENVVLDDGNNYSVSVNGDITGGHGTLSVDASALSSAYGANINLSGATTAAADVMGGAGDDFVAIGSAQGTVDFTLGGDDTFQGYGNATVEMGDTLTASDSISGAAVVSLDGDYSAGITLSMLSAVNEVDLGSGYNYNITLDPSDSNDFLLDGSSLGADDSLTADASPVTSGDVDINGGAGNDTITVGSASGNISAGGGDDIIIDNGFLGSIDGGAGNDTLVLDGAGTDLTATLSDSDISDIQNVSFDDGNNYDLTISGDITSGGGTLTVDASGLTATSAATVDVSGATTAAIDFTGGAGDDTLIVSPYGSNMGTVDGGAGNNTLQDAGGFTLSDVTVTDIQNVVYSDYDYSAGLTVTGDITGGSGTLHIDASGVGDGANDYVNLTSATTPVIDFTGGESQDTVTFGTNFNSNDVLDGGLDASNILQFDGNGADVTATLSDSQISNFDTVGLYDGNNYNLTVAGDITSGGGTLTVDASALTGSNALTLDLTAATTASIQVTGGEGDDTVAMGGNLANATIDGGAGYNTVVLDGDYSAGVTLSMLTNVNEVDLTAGHSYTITLAASNASSGDFYLAGDALGAGDSLTVDSAAVTSGEVDIDGGAGNDTITTGVTSGNTYLDLSQGGEDTVHGGSANDYIYMGNALDTGDRIDGGGGYNYVYLEGDSYAGGLNLGAGELTNINYVQMYGDHTYVLTGDPAAMNSSDYVIIDGGAMTGGSLQFDGSAVTDGAFSLYGGAGDDILLGGSGNDTLDLSVGGEDQLAGNGGNDIINAGGGLDAGDQVDGGAGTDTLNLNGDYSGGLILGATTVTNVETFNFAAGYSYNITTNDATVAAGQTLTVNASALGSANSLIFDGSAETDGSFSITGGAGNDVVTGGAGDDSFTMGSGGNDTVNGGAGDDSVYFMTTLTGSDVFNGGAGDDYLGLGGKDYTGASAIVFTATSLVSVEEIQMNVSHAYSITMNDANVAAGDTMLIDGTRSTKLTFDGSAETDGHFQIAGGAGADVLTGGQLSDTFMFYAVAGSTSSGYDTITNMNFSSDLFWLDCGSGFTTDYRPTGVDTAITTGALSTPTFNSDLAAAVNSSTLAADHAVLFTATSGTLSGHTFLVVDHNGVAGYQASADYVVDVTGYTGTLSMSSFI